MRGNGRSEGIKDLVTFAWDCGLSLAADSGESDPSPGGGGGREKAAGFGHPVRVSGAAGFCGAVCADDERDDIASGDLRGTGEGFGGTFPGHVVSATGLVALLSPIFTAGAITQEKDSQTYDILLATPLTNGQIVLGSLLSRVFFVVALLVSGIPIFAITQIFGGVAIKSIVYSFLIAASTAMVTGAMAMAIATFKIGTRQDDFQLLSVHHHLSGGDICWIGLNFFHLSYTDASGSRVQTSTSWLTALHPFLALRVIFRDKAYMPPNLADLPEGYQSWPMRWYWTSPATFYVWFMFFLSFAMMAPSILLLRRLAQSTTSIRVGCCKKLHLSKGDRTRKPRLVWHNPIAWREAKTKASAARATFLRYGFIIASGMTGCGGAAGDAQHGTARRGSLSITATIRRRIPCISRGADCRKCRWQPGADQSETARREMPGGTRRSVWKVCR